VATSSFLNAVIPLHAARLGALDRDQERQLVDGYDIAEGVPDFGSALRRGVAPQRANES
jgi:hypothetical protein